MCLLGFRSSPLLTRVADEAYKRHVYRLSGLARSGSGMKNRKATLQVLSWQLLCISAQLSTVYCDCKKVENNGKEKPNIL